jgi:hypothetical protein
MRVDIVYDDVLPIDLEHHRCHTPVEYTISAALMHGKQAMQSAPRHLRGDEGLVASRRTAAATPAKPAAEHARAPVYPSVRVACRDPGVVPCGT